ncbi:integrase, catalytic region, zinc finger, CCHC-type containing protein [Tanacetum coccineum]|uniref:Integrase, catalytic region, zinc finger, CCHC-type containing protein n=1 Tax=Tanacetum coccineum TaxID=301880 RepID=A0ABQ5B185_9ASTR
MANLYEDIQCAGSDTRPPMLDRTDFKSWQQRICLYCLGKYNGVNILKSIDEGPFKIGKFRETLAEGALHLGPERDRVFADLTPEEKESFNYTDAKYIWDNVKILLEGSKLTKDERESQLYDDFKHFYQNKGETIHEYYVRFTKLINDMRNIKMTMPKMQLNSKFVNNMLPEWGRFVTVVKLNRGLKTSNYDQLYAYLKQHEGRQNRGQGNYVRGAVAARNKGAQNRVGNTNPGQAKQIKCYNYNGNGVVLDEEQLLFIAAGQTNTFDDDVDEAPVQDLALNEDNVFQADQCDAFDSDVDEAPTAQAMFMANLSSSDPIYDKVGPSYDSDILSEYVKNNAVQVVQSNVSFVPNDALMMIINDMHEQSAQCVSANKQNKVVNESLTAELARYKEQVELYKKRARFELIEREQKIDEQMRIIIRDRNVQEELLTKEPHSVKMQLNSTINHNKLMKEEVTTLKKDFKQKENKYLEEFLDMKQLKEKVEDKLYKHDQSLQIVHMLCKPKPFYDEKKKVAIGYQNPLYLTKAKQVQPALYNSYELVKTTHAPAVVHDSEDTLELAKTTRMKMLEKSKSTMWVDSKIKIAPPDYSKEDYLATLTPYRHLIPEHIFLSEDVHKHLTNVPKPITTLMVYPSNTPAKLVPMVLPTKSQVKFNIYTLIQLFSEFDKTCKKRITPTGLTEGKRGFEQTKECYHTEWTSNVWTLKGKIFSSLIADCLSNELLYSVMNNVNTVSRFFKLHDAYIVEQACCLELEAEIFKLKHNIQKDDHSQMIKHFYNLEIDLLNFQLKYQNLKKRFGINKSQPSQDTPEFDTVFEINKMKAFLQGKNNVIRKLKEKFSQMNKRRSEANHILDFKALDFQNTELTKKVTALQEQNMLFRAENEKVKQHYKELYDSIKITHAKTIEKTASLLTKNEKLKAQLKGRMQCVPMPPVKSKVLSPKTLREIVEEARIEKPLDNALENACFYTKISQELLEYVIGTCPKEFNKRDKKVATTPLNWKKARVISSTEASGSKPRSNAKNNRILPAKSDNKKKVEDHLRNNKSNLKQKNRVDSSITSKRTCVVKYLKSVQIVPPLPLLKMFEQSLSKDLKNMETYLLMLVISGSHWKEFHFKRTMPLQAGQNNDVESLVGLKNVVKKYINSEKELGTPSSFSVGQLCDSDREVAFKKHSCYVRNEDGVDLLKGKDLVRDLPKLKFEKDHLCSACQLGKSKKYTHKPKSENTLMEVLHTLHIDLCRPIRVQKAVATAFFGALCYPTNDSKDLGKLKATIDIGIFVGYAPNRKGYRIYNKRTWRIMETIHVQFDELTEPMAPVHISIGLEPILLTPGQISSGIVPNPVSAGPYVPPTNKNLENLFQPMFDEYLKPPSAERPVPPALSVQVSVVSASTPSSTTIDQDAPSTNHSPSSSEVQAPISHQGVAAGPTFEDNLFAQAEVNPFINVFAQKPSSEESSLRDVSSAKSTQVIQPHNHLEKCSKDHPMDNVIVEPKNVKTAMDEA